MSVDGYGHSASHGALTGLANDDHAFYPKGGLAYAEVTADESFGGTSGYITGLSVTVYIPGGRRIRVIGHGTTKVGVGERAIVDVHEDGSAIGRASDREGHVGNQEQRYYGGPVLTPTAGEHTYALHYLVVSGTGHFHQAHPVSPAYILVEDIGLAP